MPVGKYAEARVTLQAIHATVHGEEHHLELTEHSCQVPVAFELKPDEGRTRVTFFLWLADALSHTQEGWQGKPAFGGSYSSNGEGPDDGSPRLGDTRCTS